MFKAIKKFLLITLLFSNVGNLFSGLLPNTKVLVGEKQYKKVENLKVGDSILVYNISTNSVEERLVQKITRKECREYILIRTEKGNIAFGPQQKVYNEKSKSLIEAKNLEENDELLFLDGSNIEIIKINRTNIIRLKKTLYDLCREDEDLFLGRLSSSLDYCF